MTQTKEALTLLTSSARTGQEGRPMSLRDWWFPHAAAAPTRQAMSNSETSTMRGHIVATTTPTTRTILRWQNFRSAS